MPNKLIVSEKLQKLAQFFSAPLYIVGGYVRDSLMNFSCNDIDLASETPPQSVRDLLANTEYKVCETSSKLMTLKIMVGDEQYEYTTFREETYTKGHSPKEVFATKDILQDAKRRDFTCNAVYYDIIQEKFVDPLKGIDDIKNKILRTVDFADKVFSQDGLRLMRLARMAAQLGFSPLDQTIEGARQNCQLIDDIAPERIRDELNLILVADTVHNIEFGHIDGLMLLDKIGVLERILPELTLGKGMPQRPDFHKYDVFFHIINTVKYSDPKVRLPALLHDIAKPYCFQKTGNYHMHEIIGGKIAEDILTKLHYSNKTIKWTSQLITLHMFDLKCDAKINTLRTFAQQHCDILEDLFLLKQADSIGSGKFSDENPTVVRLKKVYIDMQREGVPFSIKDLKITGEDILEIPPPKRTEVLNELLRQCGLLNSNLLTREQQINYIEKQVKKYNKDGEENGL